MDPFNNLKTDTIDDERTRNTIERRKSLACAQQTHAKQKEIQVLINEYDHE